MRVIHTRCRFLWLQTKRARVCWPSTVSRDPNRKIRRKDPQWVFRFAKLKLPRLARQIFQNSRETAVSAAEEVGCFPSASPKDKQGETKPQPNRPPPRGRPRPPKYGRSRARRRRRTTRTKGYSNSASNSSSRRSNNCSVLSIGADVVMSTPAAFNVSSGNLEPPDRKNCR